MARHRAPMVMSAPRRRLRWRRFGLLFVPAMLALLMLGACAATGAVPVALALEGQQTLKISAKSLTTRVGGTFPEFFQTRDGQRKATVVVALSDLKARGLCVSTRADTAVGKFVLRAETPPDGPEVSAGDVKFALESIDGVDVLGQQLGLNRAFTPDGTPTDAGGPGAVPVQAGNLALNVSATARWATVNQLQISNLSLRIGDDQPECL